MKFTSLVETDFGQIRVSTATEKWWLTTLTFGLIRKVVSTLSGTAFRREEKQQKKWAERFPFPPCNHGIEKTRTAYTVVFLFGYWQKHMVDYARIAGKILNKRNGVMRLYHCLQDANDSGDIRAAHNIFKEIRGDKSQRWRKRQCYGDKHRKNCSCQRKKNT